MKVLFIGPFDHTGYGHNSINAVQALDKAGVDVTARRIYYCPTSLKIPEKVEELLSKPARGADIVIQNVVPQDYEYDGHYASNIGYYFVETSNFRSSGWQSYINLLDQAWVACQHNKVASQSSGVKIPIEVIPCSTDITKYQRSYKPHKIRDELKDSFIFYSIGEGIVRKNIPALVRAFHLEFDPGEPVELLIKTNLQGKSPDETKSIVLHDLDNLKSELGLYSNNNRYKRELVITDFLSDEDMLRLHASCDCFFSTSYGEGFCIPCVDSLLMGKTPIVPNYGAFPDYINEASGWLVSGREIPVTSMPSVHSSLYCGRQEWFDVDINSLRKAMREAYENSTLRKKKSLEGIRQAGKFDYQTIGLMMKTLLEQGVGHVG